MVHRTPLALSDIIEALPDVVVQHPRSSKLHRMLDRIAIATAAASGFAAEEPTPSPMGGFGDVTFPFTKMGAIDTLDLFGLDELILFAFYWTNRGRYRRAADIGANLGLHSVLMARCGWSVRAYEPDPIHAKLLQRNLDLNKITSVEVVQAAVSDAPGELEFVRVLGNTTSSHLAGAKSNAYGQLERFPVKVESIADIMPTVDFVKMDAEGQERIIILGTTAGHWARTDMVVEVGTEENARAIFAHLQKLGLHAFAQKLGWGRVASVADMPTSYKDGSLFISARDEMPWA
jgi:FkbM family methyltransferase